MLLKTYVDSHTKLQKIRKQPRNHYNYETVKMIPNILLLSLLICVTSVSPNSSSAILNRPLAPTAFGEKVRENNKLHFVPSQQNSSILNDDIFKLPDIRTSNFTNNVISRRRRRHTPFLPGDHWQGLRPDFGHTETDIEVMVNGTARMKCPITHVSDNRVSCLSWKTLFKALKYTV